MDIWNKPGKNDNKDKSAGAATPPGGDRPDNNQAPLDQQAAPISDTAPQTPPIIKPAIDADLHEDDDDDALSSAPEQAKGGFIRSIYSRLDERQRQRALIIGILVLFGLLVIGLVSLSTMWQDKSKTKIAQSKSEVEKTKRTGKMTLLSERVERDLWVAAEGQNIAAIQKSNEELTAEMAKLRAEVDASNKAQKELQLESDKKVKDAGKAKRQATLPIPPPPAAGAQGSKQAPHTVGGPQKLSGVPPPPGGRSMGASTGGIRIVEDDMKGRDEKNSDGKARKKKKEDEWLPTGSFMKAVLLNGIDAPTSGSAQAEPYPVLMSIVDITTLPNRFQVDMRECFLIGAGYGNISDERAYIRTERLSCVRKNGQVVDFDLTGHVIGEDGKLGMRGRLVSKQGQQIVMALLAGTLSGFSTAMKPTGTVTLNIGDSTTTTTQTNDVKDVLASAGLGGAGSALDRVAQYYLKMAEKLFPVIEIDAGRSIEVVILKGRSMQNEKSSAEDKNENKDSDYKATKRK